MQETFWFGVWLTVRLSTNVAVQFAAIVALTWVLYQLAGYQLSDLDA